MKLSDSRTINADAATVWAGLLDADVLKACVPGCTEMSGSAEEGFEATVVQKVGPVKATFKGAVSLSDMNPPESLTISGEGKGGAAGFAKGVLTCALKRRATQPFCITMSKPRSAASWRSLAAGSLMGSQRKWRISSLKTSRMRSARLIPMKQRMATKTHRRKRAGSRNWSANNLHKQKGDP